MIDVKRCGFTLFEMLIVMLICSSMLLLGLCKSSENSSQQREKLFFEKFDLEWKNALRMANSTNIATTVYFIPNPGIIKFRYNSEKKDHDLSLPKDFKLYSNQQIEMSKTGYVAPKTVNLLNQNGKIIYQLIFQLGWGTYRVKKI